MKSINTSFASNVVVCPELLAVYVASLFGDYRRMCQRSIAIQEVNETCFLLKMRGKGESLRRVCVVCYGESTYKKLAGRDVDGLKALLQCVTVIPDNYYWVDIYLNPAGRVADCSLHKY